MNLFMKKQPLLSAEGAGTGASSGGASGAGTGSSSGTGVQAAGTGGTGEGSAGAGSGQGAGVGSGAGAGSAGAAPDWTSGFNEDLKGYIGNKGFKSPTELADSYRSLEKLRGVPQDRLLTLPERFYDDAGKLTAEGRAIREKIGAPKEAKDYNLLAPKEGADPKLLEHFRGVFHELGVPKADAEKITGSWNQYIEAQQTAAKEAAVQAFKDEQAKLTKDWGAAYEQNVNVAKEAIRTMGIDTKKIDAMSAILGHAEAMKFFHKLGTQVQEAPFINGSRGDKILEPANAKARIRELMKDQSFGKLLEKGDLEARATWDRLHQQAHVGEISVR